MEDISKKVRVRTRLAATMLAAGVAYFALRKRNVEFASTLRMPAQLGGSRSRWRGETDTVDKMQHRVKCDLHYIRNWSLALDLKIVVLTVLRGFAGPGAY